MFSRRRKKIPKTPRDTDLFIFSTTKPIKTRDTCMYTTVLLYCASCISYMLRSSRFVPNTPICTLAAATMIINNNNIVYRTRKILKHNEIYISVLCVVEGVGRSRTRTYPEFNNHAAAVHPPPVGRPR